MSSCLPAGSQQVGQHSSISSSNSLLPGSQWKASWQPTLSPLPSGFAVPSTDRAGAIGSAFSAWAPAQPSSSYSLPSVQAVNSNSDLHVGQAVSAAAAVSTGSSAGRVLVSTAPSLAPSHPPGVFPPFGFPTLQAQPAGVAPSAPQTASRLSRAGLSYKPLSLGFPLPGVAFPSQIAAQLPASPVSGSEVPTLPYGLGAPPFPGLLPHMPMLPGMPNPSTQWPLNSKLNPSSGSQALPFQPFGYSMSPYPLGFGQIPPQLPLPFQFPTDPQAASSIASAYLPSAIQGLHHLPPNLPYHLPPNLPYQLPPYPPHPMQALSTSQANPFGQSYTLPSPQNPLIKQEADSLAPKSFPPRNPAPEPQAAHRHAAGQPPQLANTSWHQAGGIPLPSGDRHTPAGTHRDKLATTNSALSFGGNIVKLESKHSGQP